MKLPIISIGIVAICFVLPGWINAAPPTDAIDALNQVSLDFFKVALKNEPGNFVTVPFGVLHLLAMAASGAGGQTRRELSTFLHMENLTHYINDDTFNFMTKWNKDVLNVENNISLDKKYALKATFNGTVSNYFKSSVKQLNFENTQQQSNTKDDGLFLLSTINFGAGWEYGFGVSQKKPFYINNTYQVDVKTMDMKRDLYMDFNKELNAYIIELPYSVPQDQEPIAMFIIVPFQIEGLKHIEDNIGKLNLTNFEHNKYTSLIRLYLPKFKLETKIDLKRHLKKMGINRAFRTNANFSGISGDKKAFINKVVQKATIYVNKDGTDDDHVARFNGIAPPMIPITIQVDHPFLFVIATNNNILFTGRVTHPLL